VITRRGFFGSLLALPLVRMLKKEKSLPVRPVWKDPYAGMSSAVSCYMPDLNQQLERIWNDGPMPDFVVDVGDLGPPFVRTERSSDRRRIRRLARGA
jgi:hypothetical protein